MKELDSFTVERLGEIKNAFLDCNKETAPNIGEIFALIDIALAAKKAEPVIFRFKYPGDDVYTYISHRKPDEFERERCTIEYLYTTPQLNSPEIPEGWKLVPIELTAEMAQAASEAHEGESYLPYTIYRAMLAAAPEKPL
ncbi:TPA: hypothetical protein PXS11_001023 [Yersinia enterocolitica]|nr:hypothetical protein [Yersinia enterocolitica]